MPDSRLPSEEILRYGLLQESSYFYARGIAFLDAQNPHRIRCTFEVGYTRGCQIIVLCYPEVTLPNETLRSVYLVVGRDLSTGIQVYADGLSCLRIEPLASNSIHTKFVATFRGPHLRTKPTKEQSIGDISEYTYYFNIVGIDLPEYLDPNNKDYDVTQNGLVKFPVSVKDDHALTLITNSAS